MTDPIRYQIPGNPPADVTGAVYLAVEEQRASVFVYQPLALEERAPGAVSLRSVVVESGADAYVFPTPEYVAANPLLYPNQPIDGRQLGTLDKDEWKRLHEQADPTKGMERMQKYAGWVLGGHTLILLLIAGSTGATQWDDEALKSGLGAIMYASSIGLLGFGFAAAVMALAPRAAQVAPFSRESMVAAYDQQLRARVGWLFASAVLLALALIAAGLVHLARLRPERAAQPEPRIELEYSLGTDRRLNAELIALDQPPNRVLELHVVPRPGRDTAPPAYVRRLTRTGHANDSIQITMPTDTSYRAVLLVACWSDPAASGDAHPRCSLPTRMRSDTLLVLTRADASQR